MKTKAHGMQQNEFAKLRVRRALCTHVPLKNTCLVNKTKIRNYIFRFLEKMLAWNLVSSLIKTRWFRICNR